MKKVSVILTVFNGEKTVEKTLNSFFNQKGINKEFCLEVLVIDDCSTDNSVKIIENFNVKLFKNTKNSGGPNKGRNIGLKNATGDYICIADQDDVWNTDKIISTLPYLEKVPVVTSGYTVNDTAKNKKIIRVNKSDKGFLYFEKNKTFINKLTKSLKGQNTYLGSIIFRKELRNIFFEEHFGVTDFDWVLKIFKDNDSIEICKSLYDRYVYGNNLSLNEDYRRIDFCYSLMTVEKYEKEYPKEAKKAYKKIHGSRARYYYLTGQMKKARFYFLKSELNLKTAAYYLTTFFGSKYIKKKFNIFG